MSMSQVDKKPVGAAYPSKFLWSEEFLQTAAVVGFIVVIVGSFFIFLTILHLLLFTKYYYLTIIYYSWFLYDRNTCHQGARRLKILQRAPFWKYIKDYFPVQVKTNIELNPNKNYICGYHPHGVICMGAANAFAFQSTNFTQIYPNIKPYLTAANFGHYVPFFREYLQIFGICSSSKESISWLLKNGKGNMVVIVIGGIAEQILSGTNKLVLSNRKGFVRLAIQAGATLIPVYAFGENKLYKYPEIPEGSLLQKYQEMVGKLTGRPPHPILNGRPIFPFTRWSFVPYKHPVDIVFGTPVEVSQNCNPTEEDINFYHNLYVQSLLKLYNEHKINYDEYKNVDLEICKSF